MKLEGKVQELTQGSETITVAERWYAVQSPLDLHADPYQIVLKGVHVGTMSGGEWGSHFCLHLFGDASALDCTRGPLTWTDAGFMIMFGKSWQRDAKKSRAANEWLQLARRWDDAHSAARQKGNDLDFENYMREAREKELKSFTTITKPLTVEEDTELLCIEGADRPWFFDPQLKAFYWVDRGVSPSTWVPYRRNKAGNWEIQANAHFIVSSAAYNRLDVDEVWREITDQRVLALLGAIENAIESHLTSLE